MLEAKDSVGQFEGHGDPVSAVSRPRIMSVLDQLEGPTAGRAVGVAPRITNLRVNAPSEHIQHLLVERFPEGGDESGRDVVRAVHQIGLPFLPRG